MTVDSTLLSTLAAVLFIMLLLAALGWQAATSATFWRRAGWWLALLAATVGAFGVLFWGFG